MTYKAEVRITVSSEIIDEKYGLEDYIRDQLEPQVKVNSIRIKTL